MKNVAWKNLLIIAGILLGFFLLVRFGLSAIIKQNEKVGQKEEFIHPRLLINNNFLLDTARWRTPMISSFLQVYGNNLDTMAYRLNQEENVSMYDRAYFAMNTAFLQNIEKNRERKSEMMTQLNHVLQDEEIFLNPISRGLTRATLLQNISLTYDFAYHSLNVDQRNRINDLIYEVMFNTQANMGHEANYSIASNWMGVRYGSVILSANAWDNFEKIEQNPGKPLLWDATKRMGDHLEANLYSNGWNGESIGYHGYDWMFAGPALIASQNNSSSDAFQLENFAPKALNSLHALSSIIVNIPTKEKLGIKPDLSDDNMMGSSLHMFAMGFRLYPEQQHPALKWMHDYLFDPENYFDDRGLLMYSLLYYPTNIEPVNPAELGWLNYHDPEQGVVVFRNRFQDENDIVSLYTATSTRVRGHQGPDNNTFRLIGLGVPWIVGAGRTGEIAGQTNLFPALNDTPETGNTDSLGILHRYQFFENGTGGYAIGSGSSTYVKDHKRFYYTSYAGNSTAAVVVVKDQSENGRRWRINTPEFNRIITEEDGFTLAGPNSATLKATVMNAEKPLKIETGQARYGGSTVRNNPGIWYRDNSYSYNNWVDIYCEGDITVVITLQPAGHTHPKAVQKGNKVFVDGLQIQLPDLQKVTIQ